MQQALWCGSSCCHAGPAHPSRDPAHHRCFGPSPEQAGKQVRSTARSGPRNHCSSLICTLPLLGTAQPSTVQAIAHHRFAIQIGCSPSSNPVWEKSMWSSSRRSIRPPNHPRRLNAAPVLGPNVYYLNVSVAAESTPFPFCVHAPNGRTSECCCTKKTRRWSPCVGIVTVTRLPHPLNVRNVSRWSSICARGEQRRLPKPQRSPHGRCSLYSKTKGYRGECGPTKGYRASVGLLSGRESAMPRFNLILVFREVALSSLDPLTKQEARAKGQGTGAGALIHTPRCRCCYVGRMGCMSQCIWLSL